MPFQVFGIPFDGNWVDIGSLGSGFLFALGRRIACAVKKLPAKNLAIEAGTGASVFPLMLMIAAPLSSHALKGLLEASKITLFIAGLLALWAIVTDGLGKPPDIGNA